MKYNGTIKNNRELEFAIFALKALLHASAEIQRISMLRLRKKAIFYTPTLSQNMRCCILKERTIL